MSALSDDRAMELSVLTEIARDQKWGWCSNPECVCAGTVHESLTLIEDELAQLGIDLAALKRAVHDEGPRPKYHKIKLDQLRLNWPSLWKPIERLTR